MRWIQFDHFTPCASTLLSWEDISWCLHLGGFYWSVGFVLITCIHKQTLNYGSPLPYSTTNGGTHGLINGLNKNVWKIACSASVRHISDVWLKDFFFALATSFKLWRCCLQRDLHIAICAPGTYNPSFCFSNWCTCHNFVSGITDICEALVCQV